MKDGKGGQLSPGTAAQEASLTSFPTLVMRKEVPKMWTSSTLHSLPSETGPLFKDLIFSAG